MCNKPYRPSNATEGDIFIAKFCENCDRFNVDGDYEPCFIVGAVLTHSIDDPEYPKEWIQDENGPRCTAYTENAEEDYRCENTIDMFEEACPNA